MLFVAIVIVNKNIDYEQQRKAGLNGQDFASTG